MSFTPQTLPDGTPNPAAVFVNATLICGLYRGDPTAFKQYADLVGGKLVAFESDPAAWTPDYGVILSGDKALVVFAGTTNSAQWVGHMMSAFFPLIDSTNNNSVVGQFYLGLNVIENAITELIQPALRGTVILAGHSYGAGALKIYADHLAGRDQTPDSLQLMTFGEPKSTGDLFRVAPRPYQHLRIVARQQGDNKRGEAVGLDPVTFTPPGILQCFKFPFLFTVPLNLLGLKWKHFGTAWGLTDFSLIPLSVYDGFVANFDPIAWTGITQNLNYAYLHYSDTSYLSKALSLYQRSQ